MIFPIRFVTFEFRIIFHSDQDRIATAFAIRHPSFPIDDNLADSKEFSNVPHVVKVFVSRVRRQVETVNRIRSFSGVDVGIRSGFTDPVYAGVLRTETG